MGYHKLIKPAFFIVLSLYLFSLWQRIPDIDDGWIGEHAYWMSKLGYVKSELMHGITQQHVKHIIHHKLFTLNGAAFIKIFGFGLYTLKAVSLIWSFIFFLIFYQYIKSRFGKDTAWFGIFLLLTNSFIFQYSFVYRPEIMVMTLGFISFIFVEKYIAEKKTFLLLPAGVAAGLAAAGHLNGLIYIGTGSLVLLWKKEYRGSILIGLFSLIGCAVYFYDFTEEYNFSYWLYQVKEAPSFIKSNLMPDSPDYFLKILREHLRFFHSPKEIILSLTLIFSTVINFKKLKNDTIYLHYLILLILLLSIITAHSTSKYLLLYMPLISIIIVSAYHKLLLSKQVKYYGKRVSVTGIVLIVAFVCIHLVYDIMLTTRKYTPKDNAYITSKYFGENSTDISILAPMDLIFDELTKYERIQSDISILEMNGYEDVTAHKFFRIADQLNIDAMMLSESFRNQYGLMTFTEDDYMKEGYDILGMERGHLILKRKK